MEGRDVYDLNHKDSGSSALADVVVPSFSPALSGEEQGLVSTAETLNAP